MRIAVLLLLLAAALGTARASGGAGAFFTEPDSLPATISQVDLLRLKEDAREQRTYRLLTGAGFLAVGVGCLLVEALLDVAVENAMEEWDPDLQARGGRRASALWPIGFASAVVGGVVMIVPWPDELEYIRAKGRVHVSWTPSLTEPAVEIALDF